MNPQQKIQETINELTALRGQVGVSPKWLNRTLSHLDNAFAAAGLVVVPGSLNDTPEAQQSSTADSGICICPEGAVDSGCPVHGQK
jgi:hypothetical protein